MAHLSPLPFRSDLPEVSGVTADLGSKGPAKLNVGDVSLEVHTQSIALRYLDVNSVLLIDGNSATLDDAAMRKPVHQIRRENFIAEVEKAGGVQKFADKYSVGLDVVSEDYVRQLMTGKDAKKWGRNIGHKAARRLETKLGKEPNWMDTDWTATSDAAAPAASRQLEALGYAISALYTMVAEERPGEAGRMAGVVRDTFPSEYLTLPFVKKLVATLEDAARPAARPRAQDT